MTHDTQNDDGGPAFPFGQISENTGMTLRDWFAGQAMVGMLSGATVDAPSDATLAKWAYSIADAMLAASKQH